MRTKNQGFTLLEMSIVLVVIGLVVGGIMAGASMIRSAELNNIITQLDKYKTATDTFKTKYESLPGDMPDAFNYWGASTGCTDANVNSDNAGCNGDGNGTISQSSQYESKRYWEHLQLAGLAEGVWNCAEADLADCLDIPGEFGPEIKIDNRVITFYPVGGFTYNGITITHAFSIIGNGYPDWSYVDEAESLTPTDAEKLDRKIDNALPESGKIHFRNQSLINTGGNCIDTTTTPYSYDLANDDIVACTGLAIYE